MTSNLTRIELALKYVAGAFTGPLGLMSIPKNNVAVIQRFGKVDRIVEHGLRWAPLGGDRSIVFTGIRTHKFEKLPMIDAVGSPILCSAVMNYKVTNPSDFIVNLNHDNQNVNAKEVIYNMTEGVMRECFKSLPLNSGTTNLRNSTPGITKAIITQTNGKIHVFGVEVDSFIVTDVNYAPEVMQQMLMKQQAQAFVDARQELVSGVVGIINNTIDKMPHLSKDVRDKITVNLFTTLTSNTSSQPVINTA